MERKRNCRTSDWEYAAIGDPVSDVAVASLELRYSLGEEGMTKFQEKCSNFLAIDSFRLSLWMIYVASSTLTYIKEWRLPEDREVIMIREAKQTIRDGLKNYIEIISKVRISFFFVIS